MRIVAGVTPGWEAYYVWHAEECRLLRDVVWVDDEANEYAVGEYHGFAFIEKVRKAKKIEIRPPRVIVINPVDDDGSGEELFQQRPLKTDKPKTVKM